MTLIQQDYIIVADELKIEVNLLLFVSISIVSIIFSSEVALLSMCYILKCISSQKCGFCDLN